MSTTNPVVWIVFYCTFGFFLGALLVWLFREREITALGTGLAEEKLRSVDLMEQLARTQLDLAEARCCVAAANERSGTIEQALEAASGRFLELATARLAKLFGIIGELDRSRDVNGAIAFFDGPS